MSEAERLAAYDEKLSAIMREVPKFAPTLRKQDAALKLAHAALTRKNGKWGEGYEKLNKEAITVIEGIIK